VADTVKGVLEFFSETGTEGGYYQFMDTSPEFAHSYEQPCWDSNDSMCPTRMTYTSGGPEYVGKRISDWHYRYEGLRSLKNGDHLKIWSKDKTEVVWEGEVELRRVDSWGPDGGTAGLRVHQKAVNMDEKKWLRWFVESLPAELTAAETNCLHEEVPR
jgi:hypothetical protein